MLNNRHCMGQVGRGRKEDVEIEKSSAATASTFSIRCQPLRSRRHILSRPF
jgi:hypothetical protein